MPRLAFRPTLSSRLVAIVALTALPFALVGCDDDRGGETEEVELTPDEQSFGGGDPTMN
ncbi:hypothetical protein [Alienimonas chondri]|uniref:Uncharacterized protein n=1 Tax=Alienimonas chondri TaxID=2681879 RepID=A0ABX1VIR9_9PLAN|nr:hypothetical protein [Alienimonas chondri]NNJ27798.1 hypothetical protein [Alienimonas chondri]